MAVLAILLVSGACATGSNDASESAPGHEVPTYRGDSARTGAMPGPGPAGNPSIVWSFQAGGPIGSSPAVVNGTVFLTSEDGMVHALDLRTGSEVWSASLGAEARAASPLVVGGAVVVGDLDGVLHALDASTGEQRWVVRVDGPIAGAAGSAGDLIVAATSVGSAYAVASDTGEVRWRTTLPGGVSRSVAVTLQVAYFGTSGGSLVAVRIEDGTIKWETKIADSGEGGTPTAAGGLVFAATGLSSDDLESSGVVAVDASTGDVRWRYASHEPANLYTPAIVDGRAFIVGKDMSVVALEASSGAPIWSTSTGASNDALASVADGFVYVATSGGTLQALSADDGGHIWQVDIKGKPYAPVVVDGLVLVGTSRGSLLAIGEGS